jgi:hypothetical protein
MQMWDDRSMTDDFPGRFCEELVRQIKGAMGLQGVPSSRALGRMTGHTSAYISDRLDGGSSKTGRRVPINARDLAEFAMALGVDPAELVAAAHAAAIDQSEGGEPPSAASSEDRPA